MGQALGPESGCLNRPKPATSAASNIGRTFIGSWAFGEAEDREARKKRLARERAKVHEKAASRHCRLDASQRRDRRPAAFPPMIR
jgi:hypothetical protein